MSNSEQIIISRKGFANLFLILNIYPVLLTIRIFHIIPKQKRILDDLMDGSPLPTSTEFVFNTYQYYWILPLISIALTLMVLFAKKNNNLLNVIAAIGTIAVSYILMVVINEVTVSPLIEIIRSL